MSTPVRSASGSRGAVQTGVREEAALQEAEARFIAGRQTTRRPDETVVSDSRRCGPGADTCEMSRLDIDVFRIQIQGSDSVTRDAEQRKKEV